MKIQIEVEVPAFQEVVVPVSYSTPIGEFSCIGEVNQVGALISYFKRLRDIEWIINSDHDNVRVMFCASQIRDKLRFVPENLVCHYSENLSYFLGGFSRNTGLKFEDYEFEHSPDSEGVCWKFDNFTKLYKSKEDLIKQAVDNFAYSKGFTYKVLE